MLTTDDRLGIAQVFLVTTIAMFILCSCGAPHDDGVNRSENGVILEPGEKFGDRR